MRSKTKSDQRRRTLARRVRGWSVLDFLGLMREAGAERVFAVYENGEFTLSHPRLMRPVQAYLELSPDFAEHEGVFLGREEGLDTLFCVFVHDTRRGLSQGGLRFWKYDSMADLLSDGLRLAQGMTRKNALAGLWWGGGKGIMPLPPGFDHPSRLSPKDPAQGELRNRLFAAYGRFVASLGGVYYTAEDIGTQTADMDNILSQNRFTTCVSRRLGGSGNPSGHTARGVFRAMQAAWLFLAGSDSLKGVRVAVQGAGNVGRPLIEMIDDAGGQVLFCDVDPAVIEALRKTRPRVQAVPPQEIFDQDVDVFAPCARGAEVNVDTIPRLKAKLICGAANNILREPEADARRLTERGIAFIPDFICNRMGITNCADEWQGHLVEDVRLAAERVYPDTLRVLRHARNLSITTLEAANQLADIAAGELNPLIGHRGRRLIDHLIGSGWHGRPRAQVRSGLDPLFDPAVAEPSLRLKWEKSDRRRDRRGAVAATPISSAFRPSVASFLSALLMDVHARAQEAFTGRPPRRVVGSDHGGHALQLAVERTLPFDREEGGRPEFFEMCSDFHNRNDAAIRQQLHDLGVGFDPRCWLDPMAPGGGEAERRLFFSLLDQGRVRRENRLIHHCPHCKTALVSSDVERSKLTLDRRFTIRFEGDGVSVPAVTYFPELTLGAAALAVRADGPYAQAVGSGVSHPVTGAPLAVLAVPDLATDAQFLAPCWDARDEEMARSGGVTRFPQIFDDSGRVRIPGQPAMPRDRARERLLEMLGEQVEVEAGQWQIDAERCGRCGSVADRRRSRQTFIDLEPALGEFSQAVESGAVQFSHPRWARDVLEHLGEWRAWCVSRQLWWGNAIPRPNGPEEREDVFSVWFSMVAGTLKGLGWPTHSNPAPIDEAFVDDQLLLRWVVPAQLTALLTTGRLAFLKVHVHGQLHVVARKLQEVEGAEASWPEEERYLFRTWRRPMRRQLGNAVEPATLIRRFGADALRLGCLLAMRSAHGEVVTLSESHLRQARNAVRRLVSKTNGLHHLTELSGGSPGPPLLGDRWMLARASAACDAARKALIGAHFGEAAWLLVELIESWRRYASAAAARPREGGNGGAVGLTIGASIAKMVESFSPVCPYLFGWLREWLEEKGLLVETAVSDEAWLDELVKALQRRRGRPVELSSADERTLKDLEEGKPDLERITGARITVAAKPSDGEAERFGPCQLTEPSRSIAGEAG